MRRAKGNEYESDTEYNRTSVQSLDRYLRENGKQHNILINKEFQKSRKSPQAEERNSGKMGRDEG